MISTKAMSADQDRDENDRGRNTPPPKKKKNQEEIKKTQEEIQNEKPNRDWS